MGDIIGYLLMTVFAVGTYTSVRFCIRKVREFNIARGNRRESYEHPMPRVRVRVIEREPEPEPEVIEVMSSVEALPPSNRSLTRQV